MKKLLTLGSAIALLYPLTMGAQVAPLSPGQGQSQISCYNFTNNLRMGANAADPATKLQILTLQAALASEGMQIPDGEIGSFGEGTRAALQAFQEKYADDVLTPFGLRRGSGYLGTVTRLKLQALYGCRASSPAQAQGAPVKVALSISSILLDSNGVTATFCNNGKTDLPTAPFRIRLNGINRDFEVVGAQKAGSCDTETFGYSSWGLTYNQGNTYTAVGLIDPNNYYKSGTISAPLGSTVLTVPALPGYHLSVRSIIPKTSGIQSTLCNLGTQDLSNFPVRVVVNGVSRDMDAGSGAYKAGQCATLNWGYDLFSLSYTPNSSYNVSVTTDPNNVYKEVNELDNTATVVGTP